MMRSVFWGVTFYMGQSSLPRHKGDLLKGETLLVEQGLDEGPQPRRGNARIRWQGRCLRVSRFVPCHIYICDNIYIYIYIICITLNVYYAIRMYIVRIGFAHLPNPEPQT